MFETTFESAIRILNEFEKDERIVIPMFKTLDFIFEKSEIIEWAVNNNYGERVFEIIQTEINGTKSILKVIHLTSNL